MTDDEMVNRYKEARWALANEMRNTRSVMRAMAVKAREVRESGDWQLAHAYDNQVSSLRSILFSLRWVSSVTRGVALSKKALP